jgi:hypothetical protein
MSKGNLRMTAANLKAKIKAAAPEGKIPCTAAFKLAEESGISRAEMGELLNELSLVWRTSLVR